MKTNICITFIYLSCSLRNRGLEKHTKIPDTNVCTVWIPLPCPCLCPQHSSSLHIPVIQPASSSLYSQPPTQYRKRESTVSETTTTTLVGGNNFNNGSALTSKMSNGGGSTVRATSVSPLLNAENAV